MFLLIGCIIREKMHFLASWLSVLMQTKILSYTLNLIKLDCFHDPPTLMFKLHPLISVVHQIVNPTLYRMLHAQSDIFTASSQSKNIL